jgi:ribonuclease HII
MVAATMTATYTARATRGERFWVIHVPGVDHYTQARNLGEAEAMAVDLIATLLKKSPKNIAVDLEVDLPKKARRHLELAATKADQASRLQNDAALERRAAARVLRDTGLTYTDIGVALGVSYQRARQLVLEDPVDVR